METRADLQSVANADLWEGRDLVADYATRDLRPVEVILLVRYREALSGRVLELGCGAGRLTGYLCAIAAEVHGIDVSTHMVEHCRRAYPQASFSRGDLRELSAFEGRPFDALVAPFNVLDVLGDGERGRALESWFEVLAPGGLLIMSSHNRAFAPRVRGPVQELAAHLRARDPLRAARAAARLPRRMANHRRLRRFELVEPAYSVLNDIAHDYSVLHYYISRDDQARQLAEHGFELLECLDHGGERVAPGELAADCPELHYVARRCA